MARSGPRRAPVPLGAKQLEELALRYVGKYATSRVKLCSYLARKIRERGWDGERAPDVEALARRFGELGYVDDSAYALMKSQSLSNRGYGRRRLDEKLRADGIGEEDSAPAYEHADSEAVDAALRYARRKRIGPFATSDSNRQQHEKAIASMVRAGHAFALARKIASMPPGEVDEDALRDELG